jgi:mutator protein MutT
MKKIQEFLLGQDKDVIKEVNVTGAVILRPGENACSVLLIQRSHDDHFPDVWEFPRGKCDKGDKNQLNKCLKREVKEETGLDIDVVKYIDKYEYIADHGTRKSTQYNFLCRLSNPNQKIKLSKEHQNYKWVQTIGEVELLIPSELKKTISKVLNIDNQIVNYPETKEVINETQKVWRYFNEEKTNH